MKSNPYETAQQVSEYLLFHYAESKDYLPYPMGPKEALNYPVRCADRCKKYSPKGGKLRALDLGCAVGRSSLELSRFCQEVIGIDYSHAFIRAAKAIQSKGSKRVWMKLEGEKGKFLTVKNPVGAKAGQVHFQQGDACALSPRLGEFDVILMANLIDRLPDPAACLKRLSSLTRKDGVVVITSPYTWMESFTPRRKWIGGGKQGTLEGLSKILKPDFKRVAVTDMPFLIREHARKFQWSVAEASVWRRK